MSSVDGLISGMNTTDVIRQLMQLERMPVTRLQTTKTGVDKAITALQGLNTKFLALRDLAQTLGGATGWARATATSSHPTNVGVTVADGTAPTSLSVKVTQLAAGHQIYSAQTYATDSELVAGANVPITVDYTAADGTAAQLTVSNHDGTLKSIAAAVNGAAGSPVTARVVKTSDSGDYRLEFAAKRTGATSAFTVSGIELTPPPTPMNYTVGTQAADAKVEVGTSATPMVITSSTNTITGIAPGVTLNLLSADPGTVVTIGVVQNTSAVVDDVEKLVNAANDILKEIKTLTAYDGTAKKPGLLQGDSALRELANGVLRSVYEVVGGDTAGSVGLELTRDGALKFDKAKFSSALAADPARVSAIFTRPDAVEGVAERLRAVAESATKTGTGSLAQLLESRRAEVRRIDESIASWDAKLALKESRLRRQFTALETALGAAQQQGNWLSGQLASLPSWD